MVLDVERACEIDSSIAECWRIFLTNCLPCTIQNLALSSVGADFTPPCMTRLWLSWTIRDVMWWSLSNRIGCFIEVRNCTNFSAKRPVHPIMPWSSVKMPNCSLQISNFGSLLKDLYISLIQSVSAAAVSWIADSSCDHVSPFSNSFMVLTNLRTRVVTLSNLCKSP